jgi:hypothetical protein
MSLYFTVSKQAEGLKELSPVHVSRFSGTHRVFK